MIWRKIMRASDRDGRAAARGRQAGCDPGVHAAVDAGDVRATLRFAASGKSASMARPAQERDRSVAAHLGQPTRSCPSAMCVRPGTRAWANSASLRTSTIVSRPMKNRSDADLTVIVSRRRTKRTRRGRSGRRAGSGPAAWAATTPTCPSGAAAPAQAADAPRRRRAGPRCRGSRPSPWAAAGRSTQT